MKEEKKEKGWKMGGKKWWRTLVGVGKGWLGEVWEEAGIGECDEEEQNALHAEFEERVGCECERARIRVLCEADRMIV